jgi:hypothetical protein
MTTMLAWLVLAGLTTADAGVETPDAALSRKEELALCLRDCAYSVAEPTVEKKGPGLLECLDRCEKANPAPAR